MEERELTTFSPCFFSRIPILQHAGIIERLGWKDTQEVTCCQSPAQDRSFPVYAILDMCLSTLFIKLQEQPSHTPTRQNAQEHHEQPNSPQVKHRGEAIVLVLTLQGSPWSQERMHIPGFTATSCSVLIHDLSQRAQVEIRVHSLSADMFQTLWFFWCIQGFRGQ